MLFLTWSGGMRDMSDAAVPISSEPDGAPRIATLDILRGMAESVAMAFLGTLMAAIVAVPLGFLGARNIVTVTLLRGDRRLERMVLPTDYPHPAPR